MGGDIVGVNMPTDMHETSVFFTLFFDKKCSFGNTQHTHIHSAFTIPVIIKLFSINADFFSKLGESSTNYVFFLLYMVIPFIPSLNGQVFERAKI
jgi:hypothetical protein